MALLEIRNVTRRFGDFVAVDNISLNIEAGEFFEILDKPGEGGCTQCNKAVLLCERFGFCPECGGAHVEITGGNEMRVKDLEVE